MFRVFNMSYHGRMPNNLAHFAINADDTARARGFYQNVFGWQFQAWGPPDFFQISTGDKTSPHIQGALQKRREIVPGARMIGYECSFSVADVDAVAAAVEANGGTIVMPKVAIPGVGKLIFFKDTEGNFAGAIQFDAGAQ
jgi:predicted enzyme related to lactoylglutathione lyase